MDLREVRCMTGSLWLWIETGGWVLWLRLWTFGFYKIGGISWVAEDVLAFQEGLCCMLFIPRPTPWRSILIVSFYLHLGLPSGLLSASLPTKTLYVLSLTTIRATCSAHLNLLELLTRIIFGEEYRAWSFSLCSLLDSTGASSILSPNIFLLLAHTWQCA
jgi:hypothetical protein